jgi:hypothetical protein
MGGVEMRKIGIFLLIYLSIFSFSNILNFVPYDFDIFIHFNNEIGSIEKIKNVPFLNFIVSDNGLAFENYLLSYLENVDYESGLKKEIFLDALSSNILFLSKGGEIRIDENVSFDLNYYIDIIRNLSKDSALIFETENATSLAYYLGALLDEKITLNGNIFNIGDSLFVSKFKNYLIVTGSKSVLDYLVSTYMTDELKFTKKYPEILEKVPSDYWFLGYSKSNAIKITFPVETIKTDIKTEYLLFYGRIDESVLKITVNQKSNKFFEKSYIVNDLMENIPVLGNYFGGISVDDSKEAIDFIKPWIFTFESTSVTKIYEITNTILNNSTSTFYVVGDVDDATNVSLAFLFKLSNGKTSIKKMLEKYNAKYDKIKDEWLMNIADDVDIYFYEYGGFFVISNLDKSIYERKASVKRLMDIPAYNFLDRKKNYDVKIFLDVGDLIYKFLGMDIDSKVIFWQEKDGFFVNYYLDIM